MAQRRWHLPSRDKRVFFAADYPMLGHARLVAEWRAQDLLDDVSHGNAESFLASIGVD